MDMPVQAPAQLPPFHPTDEDLVVLYLRRKALALPPLPPTVIPVVQDVARLDPWEVPGASEGEGYFFSLRRATSTRRRRRAGSGYWKPMGKEKPVFLQCDGGGIGDKRQLLVGVKTALAFHRREPPPPPPPSSRTGWIMHEYRLAMPRGVDEQRKKNASHGCVAEPGPGEWVVCRVFLKNRPRSRPNRDDSGKTRGHRASAGPQQQHRDEDEVSSGSITRE